jgi:hypothetical protein
MDGNAQGETDNTYYQGYYMVSCNSIDKCTNKWRDSPHRKDRDRKTIKIIRGQLPLFILNETHFRHLHSWRKAIKLNEFPHDVLSSLSRLDRFANTSKLLANDESGSGHVQCFGFGIDEPAIIEAFGSVDSVQQLDKPDCFIKIAPAKYCL